MELNSQDYSVNSRENLDLYRIPLDIWYMILSQFTFRELLKARAVNKKMGKIIVRYIKYGNTYYKDTINFLDYETYYLFDILMRNELCWTRVKTKLGKWAMKVIILNGAYTTAVIDQRKIYNHYIRTRCLEFQQYKSMFNEESEELILTLWGRYKHSSWKAMSNVGIAILKMECQFDQYIRKLYVKSYGTWLPITFDSQKIQEVQNVMTLEERTQELRLRLRSQSNICWMKYTTR